MDTLLDGYVELEVTTNFSFLQGGSHPEELVEQALLLGYKEIAIADHNTLAGVVRAYAAAKKCGVRVIVGSKIIMQDGLSVLVYPINLKGYTQLCELLSRGNIRTEKGKCELYKEDLFELLHDCILIMPAPFKLTPIYELEESFVSALLQFKEVFQDRFYMAITRRYQSFDQKLMFQLEQCSNNHGIQMVATNDVYYHHPSRRPLQDVLTCIKNKTTIQNAGFLLHSNAERYLKSIREMNRLFKCYPQAIKNARLIANRCQFSLSKLKYEYPEEIAPDGKDPQLLLEELSWKGAHEFYGEHIPEKVVKNILHELSFIKQMNYAPYFLTVHDIVRFARERGILCQGRGSAANSTICYCLGITAVDPSKFDLLFERFLSAARNEPPDIDVDFEHERREEVIQYIYNKYGRDRAAIVATVTQQHSRGAIRDIGKAMGLSIDTIEKISKSVFRYTDEMLENDHLKGLGINIQDAYIQKVIRLTHQYIGFPRQLGQHTGGFIISRNKLTHLCPILNARMEDRTNVEWNKDDIEVLGFLKVDVLALGMLTCIRKSFDLIEQHYHIKYRLATVPQDDPKVYEMISRADTIGVFQIESRAQQSMLPRLRPKCFYDLVIEVAIVRPGPIQGDMVHPYLRRRNGEEPVTYPSEAMKSILGRTLGVPLFQEQAMKVAMVGAGFTPTEADQLRRSMASFKSKGMIAVFQKKLVDGFLKNGYSLDFANRVFAQLKGFSNYGFPESHAASFAQLVYVSSWIKCYYPDVFVCALLNSQPMGFYQPAQLVADAKEHGVEVRPVDINHSFWDNSLEISGGRFKALRLGFRQVKGMHKEDIDLIVSNRTKPYRKIATLYQMGVSDAVLERMADADVFQSMGLDRRAALWEISIKDKPTGLFSEEEDIESTQHEIVLPKMPMQEEVVYDYAATFLSLKAHPVKFYREALDQLNVIKIKQFESLKNSAFVRIAGLVLLKQMPETAKGVMFITLEDESGTANIIVFNNIFQEYKKAILQSRLMLVEGKLQREKEVIHVIASKVKIVLAK
ncbi:MAG: error-prone DNA polymerase [Chitinophagaceae bacterium]|uniref:error-prone DNA polymerase n=1 Tax=unclassified Paraflavitalea TaxID=2798305 RepID=UPI003D347BCF|nr:error-prone DNA polymerase [Chitinophagaceae bacterium]